MNKSKFSEKLLAGFLVLICFLSLILVPSAGSISENAGPETHQMCIRDRRNTVSRGRNCRHNGRG